jgi:predicted DNA-binding transcriptional regulator AlpA
MSEVLYVADLARLLGMTEAAVRGHVYRRSTAVPPAFTLGRRLAWRRATVMAYLEERERRRR